MNSQITVVTPSAPCLIWESLPEEWKDAVAIVHPTQFVASQSDRAESGENVYSVSDAGYEAVSHVVNNPTYGFCRNLASLCINKFTTRQTMRTMQDIPYRLVGENLTVEWEHDPAQKLIAKPARGSGSRDVHIVKHGHQLPPLLNDRYIVERYVPDSVPRVSIDGYVCGKHIGILCMWDSVYHRQAPTTFHYLAFPSAHASDARVVRKFTDVVRELQAITGCDNQIIDMELFVEPDRVTVMEINPRLGVNYIPIYENATGYCPWRSLTRLKKGLRPIRTKPPSNGVCRYNHDYEHNRQRNGEPWGHLVHAPVKHVESHFSIYTDAHAHTYATSPVKSIDELVRLVDQTAADIPYK